MLTPTVEHTPDCDTPNVGTFLGDRGDRLARCRTCRAFAVLEIAAGTRCEECGAPTGQARYRWCPPCNLTRRSAGLSEAAEAPPRPTVPSRWRCREHPDTPVRRNARGYAVGCHTCETKTKKPATERTAA